MESRDLWVAEFCWVALLLWMVALKKLDHWCYFKRSPVKLQVDNLGKLIMFWKNSAWCCIQSVRSEIFENSGNSEIHYIGSCCSRYYSVHQARKHCAMVDYFREYTYGSCLDQLGSCCEKNLVVGIAPRCCPQFYFGSVLEYGFLD